MYRSFIEFLEDKIIVKSNEEIILKIFKIDISEAWYNFYYKGLPYKIECFTENFSEYLRRLISYIKFGYEDKDWDFSFTLRTLKNKLVKLEKVILNDKYHEDAKRRAKQIKLVLAHIDRYENSFDYYNTLPDIAEDEDILDYFNKPLTLKQKNEVAYAYNMERKNWKAIWRIISKYGESWGC